MKSINGKCRLLFAIIVLLQLIACQDSVNSIKKERIIRLLGPSSRQSSLIADIRVVVYIEDDMMDSQDFFVRKNEMIGQKIKRFKKNNKGELLLIGNNEPVVEEIDFTTNCKLIDIFFDAQGKLGIKYIDDKGQEFIVRCHP